MSLSTFIRSHHGEIIDEFAIFAKTLMPPGADRSEEELRDHADEMLTAVVRDIGTAQTAKEQSLKAEGRGSAHVMEISGELRSPWNCRRLRHSDVASDQRVLSAAIF